MISLILVAATALLYWKRAAFDPRVFWLLVASNFLTIGAELSFTAYVSVYGFMNMVGHLFRLVATYCMYLAIVAIGIREPYALLWRNMNESETRYRELFTEITNGYALHEIIVDATGTPVDYRFLKVNPAFERMTGLSAADIEGKTVKQVLPRSEQDWIETYGKVVLTGTPAQFVNHSIELGKWFEVYAFSPAPGKFATIFNDVTDRKLAEEEGARLSAIVEYSDEAIIGKTLDGIITSWNAGAERMYGYSAQEMIGKSVSLLVPPDHPDDTVTILERVKNGEPLIHYETLRRKNDGGLINVTLTASPIRDTQNHLIGISIIGHNITERKREEEEIRLTNAILSTQMEVAIEGILVVDESAKILSYNHRFTEIWGIPPDVIASRSDERVLQSVLDKLVNPEEFLARVKYLYAHREEKSREEIRLNDERTIDRYSAPMIGSDGRYYGRVWYFQDITDRKKAEQEITRIAHEWETTFDATSDGICVIDANQMIQRCNTRMGEILGGMKHEDLAGKPCWAIIHKTTGPIPECPFVSAKKTLKRTRIEIPAGDLWFEVTADPVLDSSGTFTGAVHIMRDITERKHAEEERAHLAAIVEQSDEAIIGKTLEGIITSWNIGAERMYGYSAQEMVGKSVSLLVPLDHPNDTMTILDRVKNGEPVIRYEILRRKKDGGLINVTLTASPVRDTQNRLIGISVIGHDITERKRIEKALQQVNKQLNLLSSITRHDILNQLMALKGYLYLSKEMIDNPTILTGYIQKEEQAANAIEHQIKFTKDYQELGIVAPEWQNVNANIKKAIAGLPMRDVYVDIDRTDLEIFADPLFEKVFYNLIDNALRYGGDQMKTIRFSSHRSDTSLTIICEDDGVGITAEDKKRLFTKGFGKNTGLGLFLSREILAITGITITENGTPGKGARFEIGVPKGAYRFTGTGQK